MDYAQDSYTHRGRGICLALLSALSFSLMQVFVALTGPEISITEQTFFRNLIGLIAVGFVAKRQGISFYGARRYQPYLFARSAAGFLAIVLLFYASRNAAQADVSILNRMSMFTISGVSALFLHEKLSKIHIPAMLLAFLGAFIAANPSFSSAFLPLLAAFGTALCDTISYPMISYLSGKVHSLTVVMHFCTFSTVLSVPLMVSTFVWPTGWNLFCLLMIGVFAAIGQITMTFSYRWAPAGELSIYNQIAILYSALMGFLFLDQIPSVRTLVGGGMVIAASALLFCYKQHTLRPHPSDKGTAGGTPQA